MVGLQTLDLAIGVRVPASQPPKISRDFTADKRGSKTEKSSTLCLCLCMTALKVLLSR